MTNTADRASLWLICPIERAERNLQERRQGYDDGFNSSPGKRTKRAFEQKLDDSRRHVVFELSERMWH